MNWKGRGKKWSWRNLTCYTGICLEGLRETTTTLNQYIRSPGWYLNPGHVEYDVRMTTTRPQHSSREGVLTLCLGRLLHYPLIPEIHKYRPHHAPAPPHAFVLWHFLFSLQSNDFAWNKIACAILRKTMKSIGAFLYLKLVYFGLHHSRVSAPTDQRQPFQPVQYSTVQYSTVQCSTVQSQYSAV
jgi:hypothetical protein